MASKTPCPTEHQEQCAFFQWWNIWARNLPFLAFAIPNGGARNKVTGAMLKREGVMAGMLDVFIAWPRNGKHGLFLEFKRQQDGKLSDAQKQAIEALEKAGYECHVVAGWEVAKDVVLEYAFRAETFSNF